MNRLMTMLSAASLALTLAACAAMPASAPVSAATSAPADRGRADYQTMMAWNAAYRSQIDIMQNRLQEKMKEGNAAELSAEALALTAQIKQMLKSLNALDIRDQQIEALRAKSRETLVLSGLVLIQSAETMASLDRPTGVDLAEQMKEVKQNAEKLQQTQLELQQLSERLSKLYEKR
ncbi:hypothetical protein ACOR62_07455 [Neisseria lisongii]|uniref:Lipoprotein n=1 Tax=Neisseria lisongii TaxID=2912188 RepID=A0AAW5APG9_9NEIS|nr:hypothetical protein [Neisseria lisongii]MCF7530210.1 hypothetical protein [Neisseria lisongii]